MRRWFTVIVGLCAVGMAFGQEPSVAVHAGPAMTLPIGAWSSDFLGFGGGGVTGVEYGFGGNFEPFLRLDVGYGYDLLQPGAPALSLVSTYAGGGVRYRAMPRVGIEGFIGAGYAYGLLAGGSGSGGALTARGGLGVSFMLSGLIDLGARIGYRADIGVAHLFEAWIGTSVHLSGREERQRVIDAARSSGGLLPPPPGRGLRIENLSLSEIFPVFHTYYDTHPLGSLGLENLETEPITDPKLSFLVPQFMEAPSELVLPETVEAGGSVDAEITALFTDEILSVTEATKVTGELALEYTMDGKRYGETSAVSVRLLDRNATIWDDDRRAAAFVTAKDPAILAVSKNAAGVVRDQGPDAVDRNMAVAIGLFSALDLLGVNYVIDPQTPFADFSQSATSVDYLQFPRQTLEYRGGDCDDLSALYAAMLESAGVESAFVTVPGHIYVAFCAALPASRVDRQLASGQDVIVEAGRAWIPVEVTLRRAGFMEAWSTGAREWREASGAGTARLIPVHEAWTMYEPVALPGSGESVSVDSDSLLTSFNREVDAFVAREMGPQVRAIEDRISSRGETPTLLNRLGVLYARYGRLDEAIAQFERATAGQQSAPALVNLGNVYSLSGDWAGALDYYERAAAMRPQDEAVLLGLAKAYYETEEFAKARETYQQLAAVDPAIGDEFSYLGGSGDTVARARAAGEMARRVIWSEEE